MMLSSLRNAVFVAALVATIPTPGFRLPRQDPDPMFTALETELRRATDGLARGERPAYFLGYQVWDIWGEQIFALNGAVVANTPERVRLLDVDLRVGNHRFDNTHRLAGRRPGPVRIPLDDEPGALRASLWLATENTYRRAVETLIRLESQRSTAAASPDTSPDFSRETPLHRVDAAPPALAFDRVEWEARVGRWASRLAQRPGIHASRIVLDADREVSYLVTSEGTRVRTGKTVLRLTVVAATRADDGMDLQLSRIFHGTAPDRLPTEAEVNVALDSLGAQLEALRAAPVVDPSAGPAILSPRASAVFFHEVVGHRLEGHRQKDERFGQTFTGRIGESVLPTFLSIVDDPRVREINGVDLAGHYAVDDEGVTAGPAPLVSNGMLAGFLMGRSPIAAAASSNGHGRRQPGFDPVARQGVLLVESERTVPEAELRAKLIDEIKRQNKPFGFYFDEIEGGFTLTSRGGPQAFKVLPLEVYRVYADGRPDELVRGVDVVGTPLTVLSKILMTGEHRGVFNGFCGAESGSIPVSAVSPALLVSEIEVEKRATSQARPPILPSPGGAVARRPGEDVLVVALQDELNRAKDSLRLPDLGPPYYLAYRVDDAILFEADATLGSLIRSATQRQRGLEIDLRVGTVEEDNAGGPTGTLAASLPPGDDYLGIRRTAWRATDDRYRRAAQALAQKRAQRAGQAGRDSVPGFTTEKPVTRLERAVTLTIADTVRWREAVRTTSRVFRSFPAIADSRVRVEISKRNRYFLSNEGSRHRVPREAATIIMIATARGSSGLTVTDRRVFVGVTPGDLPSQAVLDREARALAEQLTAAANAEIPDGYAGPVVFEGRAAGQLFAALLARDLGNVAAGASGSESAIERRVLRRILPPGYTVVDDPTRTTAAGTPLIGHYAIDDEGMEARAVSIVENGVLKTLPMSRTPTKRVRGSTGHGRVPSTGAEPRTSIANLIIESPPAAAVDPQGLRRQALDLAKEMGQDRVLVVRGLQERGPSVFGGLSVMAPVEGGSALTPPIDAVFAFADGRQVPVRGLLFEEVSMRALRDIVAAGREPVVYNFWLDAFALATRGRFGASIVAPPVLIEDMELRATTRREKPPVLAHPLFGVTGQ